VHESKPDCGRQQCFLFKFATQFQLDLFSAQTAFRSSFTGFHKLAMRHDSRKIWKRENESRKPVDGSNTIEKDSPGLSLEFQKYHALTSFFPSDC